MTYKDRGSSATIRDVQINYRSSFVRPVLDKVWKLMCVCVWKREKIARKSASVDIYLCYQFSGKFSLINIASSASFTLD